MTLEFSLREHKVYGAYSPAYTFSKASGTILRQTTPNSSLGRGYFFVTVPRAWLDGKYIRWRWQGYASLSREIFHAYIYDGAYDRSSDVDFPSGASLLIKGNGLLQTLDANTGTFGMETKEVQANVAGGSETDCTIFFALSDAWSAYNFWLQIDWFEINSGPTYGSDFLIGGTTSASSEWPTGGYEAELAFDNNEATRWSSADVSKPHWVKYDLGVGVTKTARKLRFKNYINQVEDFKLQGSNNDSDWDDLLSETCGAADAWREWTFANATAYRYYRILVTSGYTANQSSIWEIELMETGGGVSLYDEQFTDSVHMERTGTTGDYGYISTGVVVGIEDGSAELYAKVLVQHPSEELYAHAIIRNISSPELYGHAEIRHPASAEVYAHVVIQSSEDLYAKFKLTTVPFSLREHKSYAGLDPNYSYTKGSASVLRMTSISPPAAYGDGYFFFVVDRKWLNGKYLRFRWQSPDLFNTFYVRAIIRDGAYNRASDVDFPSGSAILSKGNGLLQTLVIRTAAFGWQTIDVQAALDAGSEDNCTVMFMMHDNQSGYGSYLEVDWLEISSGAGGAGRSYLEPFNAAVVMERTGTFGDYGYISDGFPPLAGSVDLYAHAIIRQPASAELYGNVEISAILSSSAELYGTAEIRNIDTAEVYAHFIVRNIDSAELYAHVEIQDTAELYGHAIIRQPASAELYASFEIQPLLPSSAELYGAAEIRNIGSADLYASFEAQVSLELYAHAVIRQPASVELYGHAEIQQPAPVELYAHTIIRNIGSAEAYGHGIIRNVSSLEVYAHAEIRHPGAISPTLYAHLIVRNIGSAELYSLVEIQQPASAEVYAHAVIRNIGSAEAYGHGIIRNIDTAEVYAHFIVRNIDSAELYAHTIIKNIASAEAYAHLVIRQPTFLELYGHAEIRHPDLNELYAHTIIRNIDSAEAYAHLIVKNISFAELYGHAEIRQPASIELYARTKIRHPGVPVELYGYGIIRNIDSAELYAHAVIKNIDFAEIYSRTKIRHPGIPPVELYGHVIIRQPASEDVYAHTIIKNIDSADIYAHFIVRNLSFAELYASFSAQVSLNLLVKFVVRHPYRLWTNRRYLNGVVELDEENLSDALLEYVIEGVMNDIKSRLIREDLTGYVSWTDITKTPKLIRRATTYATVATLYARDNNNPLRRIVLGIRPLAARVVQEREAQERAMDYWEEKFEKTLALFATSQSKKRMIVDTADEEPVFSMEELPFSTEDPYYIKSR